MANADVQGRELSALSENHVICCHPQQVQLSTEQCVLMHPDSSIMPVLKGLC